MRRAIYAGSFDPVTNGHLDVIQRGATLFDELVVAVGHNPAKKTLLSASERLALVQDAVSLDNVRVVQFEGMLVEAAREHDAQVILRGIRALSDFDVEFRYGLANREIAGIETLFLLTEPDNIYVSSSLIKEIAGARGDISPYVPPRVAATLARHFGPPKVP